MRALLSVYDKDGLAGLAAGLADLGWELLASGNTAAALAESGIAHRAVSDVTGAPEILGGRVKTLHPAIHGGILADRSVPGHLADLDAQGIEPIDLVVCNLYPFRSDPSVELIDIGGPTMVRAAAKNFAHVGVVVSPADYPGVLDELRADGSLSDETRRRLARAAFAHTASYDAAIVRWLDDDELLPETIHLTLERAEVLRYGENPHQHGARYRVDGRPTWWDEMVQHSGTALSYLNLFDTDAAWRLVHELSSDAARPAVAIIKHANPCGAAIAPDLVEAYRLALDCDPLSAFGGIVAVAGTIDAALGEAIAAGPQADVIVAAARSSRRGAETSARSHDGRRPACSPRPRPRARRGHRSARSAAPCCVQEADRFECVPRASWRGRDEACNLVPTSSWRRSGCWHGGSVRAHHVQRHRAHRDGRPGGRGSGPASSREWAPPSSLWPRRGTARRAPPGRPTRSSRSQMGWRCSPRAGVAAVDASQADRSGDADVIEAADAAGIAAGRSPPSATSATEAKTRDEGSTPMSAIVLDGEAPGRTAGPVRDRRSA
jgi:hypothetical protein